MKWSSRATPQTRRRTDPASVRRWNEYAVLSALRERGPQRISTLAASTGLTPAPLGEILRSLEAKNWVETHDPTSGGRGRPAQVFALRLPQGAILGLDIGPHAKRAVRLNLAGEAESRAELRVSTGAGVSERRAAVRALVQRCNTPTDGIWLTGLAVSGSVDAEGRQRDSASMPEWNGRNPADELATVLPSRTVVSNDVRAAAVAETELGAGRGHRDVLLAHLGRRPALGLLLGGKLRLGAHGNAGDFSRNVPPLTREQFAWLDPYRTGVDPFGDAIQAAAAGDEQALSGCDALISHVAPPLAMATAVLDPDIVIVGGALSPLAERFLPRLSEEIHARSSSPVRVRASNLDQYASAHGAGLLALQQVRDTLADPDRGVAPFTPEEFAGHPLKPSEPR